MWLHAPVNDLIDMAVRIHKAGHPSSVAAGRSLWFVDNNMLTAMASDDFIIYVEHIPLNPDSNQSSGNFLIAREELLTLLNSMRDFKSTLVGGQGNIEWNKCSDAFKMIDPPDDASDFAYLYETVQAAHASADNPPGKMLLGAPAAMSPTRLRKLASLSHPDFPIDLKMSIDLEWEPVLAFKTSPYAYGVVIPLVREKQDAAGLFDA